MDSWAEADWLNRFRTLVAGRTALIITHRFTTAMRADIIHVIEAGHIIESGAHNELVALDGRYGQSWKGNREAVMWPRSTELPPPVEAQQLPIGRNQHDCLSRNFNSVELQLWR